MKVAIVYSDVKREYFPTETQYITEKDALADAQAIAVYIEKMGHQPLLLPADVNLAENLNRNKPDLVINLVGSVRGKEYLASAIPGILEFLHLPFTGAGILGEALSYNKYLILKLLEKNSVPVPAHQLIVDPQEAIDPKLGYPLISKLNEIHGAVEINQTAISENEAHLRSRVKKLMQVYKQPILVQEYIVGREFTGIFFEGLGQEVFIAEKKFSSAGNKYAFATFEHQWLDTKDTFEYEKYENQQLADLVKKAFHAAKMDDYGKFDVRLGADGRYYFIDANSNPAFGPKERHCALGTITDMYGISFEKVLETLFNNNRQE